MNQKNFYTRTEMTKFSVTLLTFYPIMLKKKKRKKEKERKEKEHSNQFQNPL